MNPFCHKCDSVYELERIRNNDYLTGFFGQKINNIYMMTINIDDTTRGDESQLVFVSHQY